MAYCGGGRGLCAAQRGVVVAARRDEVPLASYSGWCFLRFMPRGHWRLRGGPKFPWQVTAGGAFSVLRRAECCVVTGPAGRCGRFSCFAHASLIKKSGQKRNHGLLWPALPSSSSARGTRASAALRAVSAGGRGKKGSFVYVEEILGRGFGGWVCGACAVRWGFVGLLPRKPLPSRCAARYAALTRGPRSAAAAFLASLMCR